MSEYRDIGFRRNIGLAFLSDHLGPYLNSRNKKPYIKQVKEMFILCSAYRYPPYQYIKHDLYKKGAPENYLDFLPERLVTYFIKTINPLDCADIVEDKSMFRSIIEHYDLPCVKEIVRRQADGRLLTSNGEEISKPSAMELLRQYGPRIFVKENFGLEGKGARIIDITECSDKIFDLPGDILYQPIIRQHPKMNELYPHAVNTVRIDTLNVDGGYINNGAVLRMGCNKNHVDNWAAGGIIVGIDIRSGRLRKKGKQKTSQGFLEFDAHPETGVTFADFQIPYWPDILDLVKTGAKAIPQLGSLGWDVAVTPDGPTIVEANYEWDIRLHQEGVGGLAKTKLGELVVQHHLSNR